MLQIGQRELQRRHDVAVDPTSPRCRVYLRDGAIRAHKETVVVDQAPGWSFEQLHRGAEICATVWDETGIFSQFEEEFNRGHVEIDEAGDCARLSTASADFVQLLHGEHSSRTSEQCQRLIGETPVCTMTCR